ncbi:hypothetical protein Coch_0860 [Capnocytophaga ochracea DSM 7271]|uniref:Uncharacterized protein n=1 Tax=Capnocytophaga ochracea (strain ATCC 27872 / DSM 7271 / CCUG 9716 / JCM 12966 / NCTC 12371 / SS31 / VPI 2845) TaxID=521097 RepID=C7M970_CAPOD|nr:hypothetical protein [Capnocytophaga ochracea]ACU92416.1 hypothetical protein Coch_0860 [Capnocytophaga ochracea DSM 7271]UAK51156.1 hypothetical protein K8O87_10450 [Capnocytophaga ochracea]
MRCIDNIKDIILDCDYKPKKGLKHRVLVIPYKDIDRRYTTLNADKTVITHLQLLPSKRGYLFELNNAFKVSGSQKFGGGFTHELSIKIDKADSGNIATMNALTKGTYVLIVETTSNTFEVLGYEAGLVVNSVQRDYAGNVIGLTFATPSDVKELRMVALWGEGDYLTMSKKFERKAFIGRNYALNSNTSIISGWKNIRISPDFKKDVKNEEYITLSFDLMFKNLKTKGRVIIEFNIVYTDESVQYINAIKWVDTDSIIGTSSSERVVNINKIINKGKETKYISELGLHIQCTADEVKLSNPKIELGNNPTDWGPADED